MAQRSGRNSQLEWLSVGDVAAILGVSYSQARTALMRSGCAYLELPGVQKRWSAADVQELAGRCVVRPDAKIKNGKIY